MIQVVKGPLVVHINQRLLSFLFRFSVELCIRSIISDVFAGTITGLINMGNATNVYIKIIMKKYVHDCSKCKIKNQVPIIYLVKMS